MAVSSAYVDGMLLSIPLRNPFVTAGGTIESRDVCLVRAENDGHVGWGEAAPFPGQDETIPELMASAATDEPTPTLLAAIDEALADLGARAKDAPLLEASTGSVPLCPAVGIEDAVATVDRAVHDGVSRFKVKIGPARISHLREIRARHPEILIAVDGNRSFGAGRMLELESLVSLGIAFAEELFDDWRSHEVLQFSERTGIPHFADESVRSLEDVRRLLAIPGLDGITVKPGRLGWSGALAARDLVRAAGKRWRSSGLLETGVGRAFSNLLAAQSDADVSDVADARMFLIEDVVDSGNGRLRSAEVAVPKGPGLGVMPDASIIDRYRVGAFSLGTWARESGS